MILSTHGSLNHGFFDLAREHMGRENVRCVTYCGELFGKYGFSRHWVNPDADLFIGAVSETAAMARRLGMPADRTAVGGFLLNPSFYRPPLTPEERATFLQSLDLDPERFTLLLSTGEHGANNHLAFLEALRKRKPRRDLQIIALCGRDVRALAKVREWARLNAKAFPVLGLPHSHMMHLLMQAADAVLGRPGTGTTSEAIISGCPIIFNAVGGFMPQEWITMRYARRHGLAETVYRAEQLPPILAGWQADPARLAALRRAWSTVGRRRIPPIFCVSSATAPPRCARAGAAGNDGSGAVRAIGRRSPGASVDPAPETPAGSRQVRRKSAGKMRQAEAEALRCALPGRQFPG